MDPFSACSPAAKEQRPVVYVANDLEFPEEPQFHVYPVPLAEDKIPDRLELSPEGVYVEKTVPKDIIDKRGCGGAAVEGGDACVIEAVQAVVDAVEPFAYDAVLVDHDLARIKERFLHEDPGHMAYEQIFLRALHDAHYDGIIVYGPFVEVPLELHRFRLYVLHFHLVNPVGEIPLFSQLPA
ncbi:MAG: hypothetical protein A4E61_00102 [Syntrophorhabdus sp. PtaB.Bin184]|nr:MAG: hypothetical protein A4E61_00102 [Syntrophorhabdus sp. PtaB.Bin184]